MAQFKIVNPSPDKFEELARLSNNMLYYFKVWQNVYGSTARQDRDNAQLRLETWLKENTVKIEPE